jgi:glycosyl-4,4'-diaponeurosporenoate acyltransferase
MLEPVLPLGLTVVVDIAAWGVFHAATGYAAHRLDDRWLARDEWLLRLRAFEAGGGWYRRHLRIGRWKDRLPEAGAIFAGGLSKRQVPAYDDASLLLFARETRRAELAHWWAMGCAPLFVLWNPPVAAGPLLAYGVAVNLPFIAIQRYNRARIAALLTRRAGRGPALHPDVRDGDGPR